MTQNKHTTESRQGKHLNYSERKDIEHWKNEARLSNREIARRLNRAPQTIHTEIKDGTIRQIKHQKQAGKVYEYESFVYAADAGQAAYDQARKHSRKPFKSVHCSAFMAYAEEKLSKQHHSPDAIVGRARKMHLFPAEQIPCTTTLYHYIDLGLMRTKNIDLLLKTRRKNKRKHVRENKRVLGDSIEKRPDHVDQREEFGHWEIDTVIGSKTGSSPVLLTLTERKTRYEYLLKIDGKASLPVNHALEQLKKQAGRYFSTIFKSITSDNGVEFSSLAKDFSQDSAIYFTHPYSSYERGTNENHNGMIRRFFPKKTSFTTISDPEIQRVKHWMNDLPRKILDYDTPEERFLDELQELLHEEVAAFESFSKTVPVIHSKSTALLSSIGRRRKDLTTSLSS